MTEYKGSPAVPRDSELIPGERSAAHEAAVQKKLTSLIFHNQEYAHSHNSYIQEQLELESIASGDCRTLVSCWKDVQANSYGTLSENGLENVKFLCVSLITLASRAAIHGGMQPELAFSICDCYICEIAGMDDKIAIVQLARRAQFHFASYIQHLKKIQHEKKNKVTPATSLDDYPSPHINACKKYIFAHLHGKLTVQEVADAVHLSPNYLSVIFREEEGIPLYTYITREKIHLAQNLLIYSDYSYSEIATYLGFSSQSHLTTQFRKYTGFTPARYRERFHLQEFKSHSQGGGQ